MKKSSCLRGLLESPNLEFLCEAHNGLSAKIVEEAGFKAIWASSLTISASMGVRDCNELSWTQILEIIEFMNDGVNIPILLDADTGYGNFNIIQRVVKKLEKIGIAGMCIEDKIFPKTNSLISGARQPLADIDEFCGRIKAAKDAQTDPDFCVIARIEAFIAGWGLKEALKRAQAYYKAGADAILVHSKKPTAEEIISFAREWQDACPIVIVPTTYYTTPIEVFEKYKISVVIWANHVLRAAVKAMQEITRQIYEDKGLHRIEEKIAPVEEIFRLQNFDIFVEAERKYLPAQRDISAIVLAASRGDTLFEITKDKPKTMIPIQNKPILVKQVEAFNDCGIKDIYVVRGYKKEKISLPNIKPIDNEEYATTGELYSLKKALEHVDNSCIISYGDILFKKYILIKLLNEKGDIRIVVDSDWQSRQNKKGVFDYVTCTSSNMKDYFEESIYLEYMSNNINRNKIHGEWIGLAYFSEKGIKILKEAIQNLENHPKFQKMNLCEVFNQIIKKGYKINVTYIRGDWLDVDEMSDILSTTTF